MGNPGILSWLGVPRHGSAIQQQIPGIRRAQNPPAWEAAAGWEQRELVRAPTAQTGGFFQRCRQEGNAVTAWKMSAEDKGGEGEVRFR